MIPLHHLIKQIQVDDPKPLSKAQMLLAIALIHTRTPQERKQKAKRFFPRKSEALIEEKTLMQAPLIPDRHLRW